MKNYLLILLLIFLGSCCHNIFTGLSRAEKEKKIITIAEDAVKKNIGIIPANAIIKINEERGMYIVTYTTPSVENVIIEDFGAQVFIDSKTGKVLQILVN